MATLSELQTRLEALRKARASGVKSTTHQDTTTVWKSDAEMAAAEAALEAQIATLSERPRVRYTYQYGKGL